MAGPEKSEKFTHNGEVMYALGNQEPIAHCCLIANRGENTRAPLFNTANDLQYVATTFTKVGAKIEYQQQYKGMELADVESLLNILRSMNLKSCPCFIFYYSGHGKDCGIQLDEDNTFSFRKILDAVTSLPDLLGKPKVFIFDCCRVYDDQPECRKNCKAESYTDCLIAYACSSGEQAFISNSPRAVNDSIFTKAFCAMLLSNHRQWPLVSILIHASSLTKNSMDDYYHQTRLLSANKQELIVSSQTPHVILKLRKQLYLCFDSYVERTVDANHMDFELSSDKNYYRDGGSTKRRQFNSKEDVTQNLGSLGQWLKVFICYAPSVNSKSTDGKLESRIYTFARHLITYGFDVRVDLFASFTVGFDWASWTDREMSQADWIIFVNSQSSYELLYHPSGPKEVDVSAPHVAKSNSFDTAVNEATKKIRFSGRSLYSRIYHDKTLKIISVILREEDNKSEYILPILRDTNSVLHVYKDVPFDYDKLEGHFERLICRMAGINRVAINNTGVGHNFIKLPSKIPPRSAMQSHNQAVEQEVTSHAAMNSPYRLISSVGSIPETRSYQASPQHYYHNTHSQETTQQLSLNTMAQESYPPVAAPVWQSQQPQFRQPQYPQYSEHSRSSSQCNNSEMLQPHRMHNGTSQHLATSRNIPVPNKAPVLTKAPVHDLPGHKIPVDSPILWQLSQDIREWKFLGRFLDLEEDVIEEIDQYTRPNKTRDKSLKVLTEWVNGSSDATWKALGEALLEAENKMLYEKLQELIKSYNS